MATNPDPSKEPIMFLFSSALLWRRKFLAHILQSLTFPPWSSFGIKTDRSSISEKNGSFFVFYFGTTRRESVTIGNIINRVDKLIKSCLPRFFFSLFQCSLGPGRNDVQVGKWRTLLLFPTERVGWRSKSMGKILSLPMPIAKASGDVPANICRHSPQFILFCFVFF